MAAVFFRRAARIFWKRANSNNDYWIVRFVLLRILGLTYFFAFLSLATQVIPLIGDNGLLPAGNYLDAVGSRFDARTDAFQALPTLFWLGISDTSLQLLSWLGVLLSLLIVLGFANSVILLINWLLYMSFVHVGQIWYGYGWETQLLETGFLAIFLVPLLDARPFPKTAPPVPIMWLFRWLAFRVNLGAGLIKIRHDACWRELTCLFYHYETQPLPNPLSPWFHAMPQFIDKLGVAATHVVQIAMPFLIFTWRHSRIIAGISLLLFQLLLMLTGNYSFLNLVTIIPIIAVFDDKFLKKLMPKWISKRAENAASRAKPNRLQQAISWVVVFMVIGLSVPVIANLLSPAQAMNASFDQLHLVNTYGAFGSITKARHELVFQGTIDQTITSQTEWKEYEFKAKPTSVSRQHPIIAPYQPRVDWQLWFAAFQRPEQNPWIIHLIWKFLHNDKGALSLIAKNPFPEEPPKHIRVEYYRYEMLLPNDESGNYWRRTYVGSYIPPLSAGNQQLREFIAANNWDTYE